MNARIRYLKDYVEEMRRQAVLFNSVNMDMLRQYGDRMVRVTDAMGNICCGFFRGFSVSADSSGDSLALDMHIRLQLPKKDGTPSGRVRSVNCRDALFRLMGGEDTARDHSRKKRLPL